MENSNERKETPENNENKSLIHIIFSLPPQLLSLLVICNRPIHLIAQLSLIISWSHPQGPWPSWILLFVWYSVCKILPFILSHGIPNLICLIIITISTYLTNQQQQHTQNLPSPIEPETTTISTHPLAILHSLQDFQIIADHYSLLSSQIIIPTYQIFTHSNPPHSSSNAIKACLTTIPISILLTQFIPTQSILIMIGSTIIIWSSPWFKLLRSLLARSPLLQLISYIFTDLFLHLRFQPLMRWNQLNPTNVHSTQSILSSIRSTLSTLLSLPKKPTNVDSKDKCAIASTIDPPKDIEFCLTIFENQRWWMGLDLNGWFFSHCTRVHGSQWTPNLLPHERPNWSDSLNHPVPSPSNFQLPAPLVFPDDTLKVQRKVEWSWIDPDWKIIDPAQVNMSNEEHHPLLPQASQDSKNLAISPLEKSPTATHTPPQTPDLAQRCLHNRSVSQTGSIGNNYLDSEIVTESLRSSGLGAGVVDGQSPKIAAGWEVDANGWQYGDNHWDKMSKKSGIGRYTRRRAWTRKAQLISYILPTLSQSSPSPPSPPEDHPPPVLLDRLPASPASPRIGTPSTAAIVPGTTTTSTTALSLNLKRSLGLLRRK
ncbi:hypothetical protein VP01_3054g1 [Puccinia sorghi]|uniref:TECPR1-like DysF domain-containing protein n=1 Tax=Puccinia sorghi TaxID=27349 RepID=A0A0L6V0N5_9BASI|nr:hypothetical protein VP01_3054g1 [Puccinia sorghi]